VTAVTNSLLGRAAAALVAAVWLVLAVPAPQAHAADAVGSYTVDATVVPDGTIEARATIDLEGAPGTVVQRFATTQRVLDDRLYRYAIDVTEVTADGRAVTPDVSTADGYLQVSVPTDGARRVELAYRVRGASVATSDDTTTVSWRFLQGLNLPVRTFRATVSVPGLFTSLDCRAGAPGDPGVCADFSGGTHEQSDPYVHDGPRGAGEIVQVVLRFPAATVAANADVVQLWSLDRAFSTAPLPLGTAALLALVGALALWMAHRRLGRDAAVPAHPQMIGSFRPVGPGQSEFALTGDVRPGEVGTLLDERVDPLDVTATVLDLAVRNHLRITQVPRTSEFAPTEWAFERVESAAALLDYERAILDAIAPATGRMLLSEVGPALHAALPRVQSGLYDEVVRNGWFAVRPDTTRGRWAVLGWAALAVAAVAAALLVAFTSYGLAALVLVALAAGVGMVGQAMPARTPKGAAVLAGLGVLRGLLATQPTDEMPRGREHEELGQVLPYAVVLGGADRWLAGLAAVDDASRRDETELTWYHGPEGWRLADLPDSLRSFIRAFEGTLVAR